jgi:transcription elongation factor
MKKIIVSLLVLSVVACTNTIKKENISLKGRHYITKNSNIPVDGLLKEKVDGKNIKIKIENGYVVSKESDNILYPFKNFRLNEKVEVKKINFFISKMVFYKELLKMKTIFLFIMEFQNI